MSSGQAISMWPEQLLGWSTNPHSRRNAFVVIGLMLTVLDGPASCAPMKVPRFRDYPVADIYRGPVRPPEVGSLSQYTGSDLRCFGEGAAGFINQSINFSGHFVIAACTCGSGCRYLFLWDAKDGRLYRDLPFGAFNVGPYGSGQSGSILYKGENYQVRSSLLILEGCIEGTCDCSTSYYYWTGKRFILILRRMPKQLPKDCQ